MSEPYLPFEHFEALTANAKEVWISDSGLFHLDGHLFLQPLWSPMLNCQLDRCCWVRAFIDHTNPLCLAAVVLTPWREYICTANETDHMGVMLLKPGALEFFL